MAGSPNRLPSAGFFRLFRRLHTHDQRTKSLPAGITKEQFAD
jgi:hypothetical protein